MPRTRLLPLLLPLCVCACDGSGAASADAATALAAVRTRLPAPPPEPDAVLLAVGDIGECGSPGRERTAALLDRVPGPIATLGDQAYPMGTVDDFKRCFLPAWGRHVARIHPSLGNHDLRTAGAPGYEQTFRTALHAMGDEAEDPGAGWYAWMVGEWRVIALNTNRPRDPRQIAWLRRTLRDHPARCTVAYMHHPRFSSGEHGGSPAIQPLWEVMHDGGVDLVLAGHDHDYERFAPLRPDGRRDSDRGIRQIVVGTGGAFTRPFRRFTAPGSEVKLAHTFGVLRLALSAGGYRWEFLSADRPGAVLDSGSGTCH
jgi:hypothetical protein